jgi:hypothetical protein
MRRHLYASGGPLAEQRLRNHVLIQGERFADFVAMIGSSPAAPRRK